MPYSIMFNEEFSNVTVNGKQCEVMTSTEMLGDSFLIGEAMKPVLDGIKNGRYISSLGDGEERIEGVAYTGIGIDTGSKVINYKLFLEELRKSTKVIPQDLRKNIEKDVICNLISKTYLVKPENMKELQNFIGKLTPENITNEENVQKLYDFTERLNQARKNYIEQEKKQGLIYFRTEDAKKSWRENEMAKEKRKENIEFRQNVNAFLLTDGAQCVVEPLDVRTDEEHYSTMQGVTYRIKDRVQYTTASASKVDYETFCDKLKEASANIAENKRDHFVKCAIEGSIDMWYGYGGGYTDVDRINDERDELLKELTGVLEGKINGNLELDTAKTSEIESKFLELSREEEGYCKEVLEKRKPVIYENLDVRRDYETIKSIHETSTIPEEAKKPIIVELKNKSKTTLESKRRMDAFAKLVLSGENVPSREDINKATRNIDFYKDMDRD